MTDRIRAAEGTYTDGPTAFYGLTGWGKPAEGFAEQVRTGGRVIAAGELTVGEWTDCEGDTRRKRSITADHAGVCTRFTAKAAG